MEKEFFCFRCYRWHSIEVPNHSYTALVPYRESIKSKWTKRKEKRFACNGNGDKSNEIKSSGL